MSTSLRVGGRWCHVETAPHSPPVWSTTAQGGCGGASWTFHLPPTAMPIGVRKGAIVEIFEGAQRVYLGRIRSIDRDSWGVTASGLYDDLIGIPALASAGGNATMNLATALAAARSAPFNWPGRNTRGEVGTVHGGTTDVLMVSRLAEMWAEQSGEHVGVDEWGEFYSTAPATAPKWLIHPAANEVELSSGTDETYNLYLGRYRTSGGYANAYSTPPVPEGELASTGIVDLTQRGVLSALDATAILTKLRDLTADRPTWTNEMTLTSSQIRTIGGQPAPLSMVRGGDRARVVGLSAAQQAEIGSPYLDVTLASVTHPEDRDQIVVEPAGALPLTLEAAMEAIAG